jgi:hypothetical protein
LKSLMSLVRTILNEIGNRCDASTTDDYKTIVGRVEHEGLSFLTITLANLGKDFQKSLDQGFVAPSAFTGFSRAGALPRFLGGLLELVFDKRTGVLLNDPSIDAIAGIYQLLAMFAKIELDCTENRVKAAYAAYVQCERDIKISDKHFSDELRKDFIKTSSLLFSGVFSQVSIMINNRDLIPHHGPGATAEKLSSNKKYVSMHWNSRLEDMFPHMENMYPNYLAALEEPFGLVDIREPGDELPVRVIHVPKTLKTPRIIGIEPTHMQYMQQALKDALVPRLESDKLVGSMIGFTDQLPNQEMARQGSYDGSLATLDLSEASDRVSNQHVLALFAAWPLLSEAVQATRSRKADVPGKGVIRLSKFASMGSALCFPVEAMVFLTIVFMGISRSLNTPVSEKLLKKFIGRVRVYGDDIIVPREHAEAVATTLELLGYKVNTTKSFWTGKFRESCGGDFYGGEWITPIRLRRMLPRQWQQPDEVVSFSSFRNQLYKAGYWETVAWCDAYLENILGGVYPYVEETSNAVGRHTFLSLPEAERMCPNLHRPMVKAYVRKDKLPNDNLDGYGALMKFFIKKGENPTFNKEHLIVAGRPLASRMIKRWTYRD